MRGSCCALKINEGDNCKIMKSLQWVGSIFLFLLTWSTFAQADYNSFYKGMNPSHDSLTIKEKQIVLQAFLDTAQANNDTVEIIHGYMYLANLAVRNGDYSTTSDYLLAAEELAEDQRNYLLLGRIFHRKASVYSHLEDYQQAIKLFSTAEDFHLLARDSQYLGITYEQLGAMYGYIDSFAVAENYYQQAISIIKKHGSEMSLAVAYTNYGNVLAYQDNQQAAIRSYEQASIISKRLNDEYQLAACLQNMAGEYVKLEYYDTAFTLYHQALDLNESYAWSRFLIDTYWGLAGLHEATNQFDSAVYYHHLYEGLRDSIMGPQVQTEIARSEAAQTLAEKEKVLVAQTSFTRLIIIIASISLLVVGGVLLMLFLKHRKNSQELAVNRARLMALTKTLQTKNTPLQDVQQMSNQLEETEPQREPDSLSGFDPYDSKILRTEDWEEFKQLFEKSYPGYVRKLRVAFPALTEAEERLFLFLKLKLTSREIANMLGIQSSSVKKTRTRLRKRLRLASSESLTKFINEF